MNKSIIILVSLFLLSVACERSQFSVTTRHSKNGKVTYAKHYRNEPSQWAKVKTPKSLARQGDNKNTLPASDRQDMLSGQGSEINRINAESAYGTGSLIASNSKEPVILAVNETLIVSDNKQIMADRNPGIAEKFNDNPDTIRNSKSDQDKPSPVLGKKIIKFKNGKMEAGKILYQAADTLKYKPAGKDTVLTVRMSDVEKILPDTRKMEPLGIIALGCSLLAFVPFLLGLLPVIGIPLAVIGIILGIISIKRIKHRIDKYKGSGFGKAGLVVGVAAMVLIIILLISMVASAFGGCSSMTFDV